MAAVGRLHPRHWDGHRLLQFLTGLALLALAFGTTAASATPVSPPAVAVTTTVEVPAAPVAAAVVRDDKASMPFRTTGHSAERQQDGARVAHALPPAADAMLAGAVHALPPAADAALAGAARPAHGSRAPPR